MSSGVTQCPFLLLCFFFWHSLRRCVGVCLSLRSAGEVLQDGGPSVPEVRQPLHQGRSVGARQADVRAGSGEAEGFWQRKKTARVVAAVRCPTGIPRILSFWTALLLLLLLAVLLSICRVIHYYCQERSLWARSVRPVGQDGVCKRTGCQTSFFLFSTARTCSACWPYTPSKPLTFTVLRGCQRAHQLSLST